MATKVDKTKLDRHCSCCLKFLPAGTWKVCGKCKRRAYCSRECQSADWKTGIGSQGHKNWCHLQCGEEDLDWEVKEVTGKGLGIIAKRYIPAKSRIMVDAVRDHDHPAIEDLMPTNGTLNEKIALNAFGNQLETPALCLRIARINHDCDPNAGHSYHVDNHVTILYAEKDIQPGEEITISYVGIKNFTVNESKEPEMFRNLLQHKWGIVCKEDCICHNDQLAKDVEECRKLARQICELETNATAAGIDTAMQLVRHLLQLQESIRAPLVCKCRILFQGFQIGMKKHDTLGEAMNYLRQAYDITSACFSPGTCCIKLS